MPHDHHGHGHDGHGHGMEQKTVAPKQVPNVTLVTDKPNLAVSERASKEIQTIMEAEKAQGAALRLGVEPGGCAGFQYALSFATSPESDEVVAESNGVKVFVAKRDLAVLNGVTIDFVESAMGAGFNIKNPNAKSTCGCGNTFDA
jgi:iron-sulfur cluster assembly accessory protein